MYTAGTNFPPHLYDGHLFGKESFYEELAKVQKTEMDKREKVADCIKFCLRCLFSGPWSEEEVGGKCQKSEFSAKEKQMGHPRGKQPSPPPKSNYLHIFRCRVLAVGRAPRELWYQLLEVWTRRSSQTTHLDSKSEPCDNKIAVSKKNKQCRTKQDR